MYCPCTYHAGIWWEGWGVVALILSLGMEVKRLPHNLVTLFQRKEPMAPIHYIAVWAPELLVWTYRVSRLEVYKNICLCFSA
jgi:hypothetical protein